MPKLRPETIIRKIVVWIASLPLDLVAETSLFPGLALSTSGGEGWRELGHTWLLLSIVPILAWAISNWWTGRRRSRK
jgi:hypothetical protein